MPYMKTKEDILRMVELFDKHEEGVAELDTEQSCIRDALNWVLGHHEDSTITSWIEE